MSNLRKQTSINTGFFSLNFLFKKPFLQLKKVIKRKKCLNFQEIMGTDFSQRFSNVSHVSTQKNNYTLDMNEKLSGKTYLK